MNPFDVPVQTKLPGEMWAVTTCFNPVGHANKYGHLQRFSAGVRGQGIKLLVVELAFADQPFRVPDDAADIVLRLTSDAVLWQKERLLNIAFKALPAACDKIAWLDADLIFLNANWVGETAALLERYALVQLFEGYSPLPQGVVPAPATLESTFEGLPLRAGAAFARLSGDLAKQQDALPGGAWAARRSLLDQHGIYDCFIMGGGDTALLFAMFGQIDDWLNDRWIRVLLPAPLSADLRRWSASFFCSAQASVGYTPGRVLHLWHGEVAQRRYALRLAALLDAGFDPTTDIALDEAGCWRWNSDKPKLHRAVEQYFLGRREEG